MLKTEDLKAEIRRLCKEKDAIILAHYYTIGDIQDIADFVGDSLALARKAAETDAKIMVMCGVHFMAETCKVQLIYFFKKGSHSEAPECKMSSYLSDVHRSTHNDII